MHDQEEGEPPIRCVISLGFAQYTAQVLQDAGLTRFQLPFDKIFSGPGLIRDSLLDDFEAFLARDDYVNCGQAHTWTIPLFQKRYGNATIFHHHNLADDTDYEHLVRSVECFRRVFQSRVPKLFVHIIAEEHARNELYLQLLDVIRERTEGAQFLTIGLKPQAEEPHQAEFRHAPDHRIVYFTPISELVGGHKFSEETDNVRIQEIFHSYRYDIVDYPNELDLSPEIRKKRQAASLKATVLDVDQAAHALSSVHVETFTTEAFDSRPAPDFLYGPCDAAQRSHFHNDQYIAPVRLIRVTHAELIGPFFVTGALIRTGQTLLRIPEIASDPERDESRQRLMEMHRHVEGGFARRHVITGQAVLLACNGHQIYGHWLVDFLPKLALLSRSGYNIETITVLLPTNMPSFGQALLQLIGLRKDQIVQYDPRNEVLDIEELLIPSTLRWGGRCVPFFGDAIDWLNTRINACQTIPQTSCSSKIFISRILGSAHGRILIGEEALIEEARRFGFMPVAPEQLPLLEQIALLRNATHIIGPYGSGLHGSIFSPRGTIVCGFHGQASFDALQSGIGERLHQPTGYIFGTHPPDARDDNANQLSLKDFRSCLERHCAG